MAKIKRSELEVAEKKYQAMIEKRDAFNAEAEVVRGERDTFHTQKRELIERMKALKTERQALAEILKNHKTQRDQYQKKAKELIASRKDKKKKIYLNLNEEIEALRAEIKMMDLKQQTDTLTLVEENELIDAMKSKIKDLERLETLAKDQDVVVTEVKDLDHAIDELFEKAEIEHQEVLKLSLEVKQINDKIVSLVNEIAHLITEANKKHKIYIKIKEKANYYHMRAVEMRNKVIIIRKEKWKEREEARKYIQAQSAVIKKTLEDEETLDKLAESAVQELFKKGKIAIR